MGNILSCCFKADTEEADPLLQEQDGYGSQGQLDYNEMEQRQQERMLERERELTEIVNNTNDKLIDIGMISNSGIVATSRDFDPLLADTKPVEPLTAASSGTMSEKTKESVRNFYDKYFQMLEKNCTIQYSKPLVTDIQA